MKKPEKENMKTVKEVYKALKEDVKIKEASTAIEGNPLSLEEVSKLAQGRKVTATRRAKQEVLNYLNVLENIEKYQESGEF